MVSKSVETVYVGCCYMPKQRLTIVGGGAVAEICHLPAIAKQENEERRIEKWLMLSLLIATLEVAKAVL